MPLTGSTEKWASQILCNSDSLITQHPTVYTHENFKGEEAEWELDAILDKRVIRKKNQYLVKYKGYKLLRDCEWRPEAELQELAPELLAEFNEEVKKASDKP